MPKRHTLEEKIMILRNAFNDLQSRGINSVWTNSVEPFTDLRDECRLLMTDDQFRQDLQEYLQSHTIVRRALNMFFTQIAMSARAQWRDAPEEVRGIAARGWFLGRWIPTFLIIDGPIGRFFSGANSPLSSRIGPHLPLLASARDFLNDRLFRTLRNGFAHWGFDWEVVGRESYVVAYDWERDLPSAKLHSKEADAFHIIAFAMIEILDDVIISQRNEI